MLLTRLLHRHAFTVPLTFGFALLAGVRPSAARGESSPVLARGIDETSLVTLAGNTHHLAVARYDRGRVIDSMPMEHMFLVLRRTPDQDKALTALLTAIQTPQSQTYHHWLSAEELASYGPNQEDLATLTSWLERYGLQVNGVSKSGLTMDVSGSAGQVRAAFHTEIHTYSIKGKSYIANASDPQIPTALQPLVAGFNSLNSFLPRPLMKKPTGAFSYDLHGYEEYDEAPADLAKIYNAAPLYTAKKPITGKGQTVVVLEDTDINPADVATFRKSFGLSSYAGSFEQIHPGAGCTDPGSNAAEDEAALDAEWAGSVAPDAAVHLASCADTQTSFGAFIAAQNLLDLASPPPILSLSYASCEADQGASGNLFISQLWQQAALEGVSVFVSAGDGGAAGCDNYDDATYSVGGIAANGLGSTPFNTATGGTDFADVAEGGAGEFWNRSNGNLGASAKSYVPEMTWDNSCASAILQSYYGFAQGAALCDTGSNLDINAASGAPSKVYSKPYWQANVYGNPADGARDLPDVSLFAANGLWYHAILYCMSDSAQGGSPCEYSNSTDAHLNSAGGTSFTAPQYASIQALINQKAGGPQGNVAVVYYDLGKDEYGRATTPNTASLATCNATAGGNSGSPCTFHDVALGDTAVPCEGTLNCYGATRTGYGILSPSDTDLDPAYPATSGWDFATGLGTVNIVNVVNRWPAADNR